MESHITVDDLSTMVWLSALWRPASKLLVWHKKCEISARFHCSFCRHLNIIERFPAMRQIAKKRPNSNLPKLPVCTFKNSLREWMERNRVSRAEGSEASKSNTEMQAASCDASSSQR